MKASTRAITKDEGDFPHPLTLKQACESLELYKSEVLNICAWVDDTFGKDGDAAKHALKKAAAETARLERKIRSDASNRRANRLQAHETRIKRPSGKRQIRLDATQAKGRTRRS